MVNENFYKFRKVQREHRAHYLGSEINQKQGVNDEEYNNQKDTDKSPGSTGRIL